MHDYELEEYFKYYFILERLGQEFYISGERIIKLYEADNRYLKKPLFFVVLQTY